MSDANLRAFQAADAEGEAMTYPLPWRDRDDLPHEEKFTGTPSLIAPITIMRLSGVGESNNLDVVLQLLRQAMGPGEYRRFDAFCQDPAHLIDAEEIVKCMQFFVEASQGRPTEPSSS